MNNKFYLDEIDKQILRYLTENTRTPYTEIAKNLDVSAGTIHVRMKKMEEAGLVKGTTLVLDYPTLGYDFIAYVGILLTKSSKTSEVMNQLVKIPNVTVASVISGKFNIFCKIHARDTMDAKDVIFKIDEIEDVMRTESMISLEEVINDKSRLLNSIFL
ncbi:MAG: winged helix-turn-helix transcriptional regulator [Weeksellaceae bacterium]|nr:winged helix-turn-helix transcriptional regulator [Weeksellaceae bacterium]